MSYFIKIAISVLLLIIFSYNTDFISLEENLFSLTFFNTFICFTVFLVACFVSAYKWNILLPKHNYFELVKYTFIGIFYSVVLPGQIAGEVMKIYRLGKKNIEIIAASVLVDRIIGLVAILVVANLGFLLASNDFSPNFSFIFLGLTVFLVIFLFSLQVNLFNRFFFGLVQYLSKKTLRFRWLFSKFELFLVAWLSYTKSYYRLFLCLVMGILFQLLLVLVVYILAREINIYIQFFDWCWIFAVVSFAVLLPITIGGFGVREGVFVSALNLFGVPVEKAIALSFAVFGITLLGVLIGFIFEAFSRDIELKN